MRKVLLSMTAVATLSCSAVYADTIVKSKAAVLKFNGKHYLGFVQSENDIDKTTTNGFETRRNYLQVKAYFDENSKNYARVTLDTKDRDGESYIRLKYAYLYLDNILPYTGVEMGQVHRTWIDYEQKGSWNYRSINKVFAESTAKLTNSADRGINFKTKMKNFSSELGVFNGEGYSGEQTEDGLSLEYRLTYHGLGGGDEKSKIKNRYANISVFGQQNRKSNKHGNKNLNWYGVHAVYNQPEFLLSAQYIKTSDAIDKYAGEGYSTNGAYRFIKNWNLIGRYDYFKLDKDSTKRTKMIAGIAHKYSKNIEFIANVLTEEEKKGSVKSVDNSSFMLTAEVKW